MKTLAQLWEEVGQKPFDAADKDGVIYHAIGIAPDGDVLGWWKGNGFATLLESNRDRWALHKEKKLVPHWPAVKKSLLEGYFVTDYLYHSDNCRGKEDFVRLATEYPPVMLEVEE